MVEVVSKPSQDLLSRPLLIVCSDPGDDHDPSRVHRLEPPGDSPFPQGLVRLSGPMMGPLADLDPLCDRRPGPRGRRGPRGPPESAV
jgi:hypothetical protein